MTATDFAGREFDLVAGEVYGIRAWTLRSPLDMRLSHPPQLRPRHNSFAPPWTAGVNTSTCFNREALGQLVPPRDGARIEQTALVKNDSSRTVFARGHYRKTGQSLGPPLRELHVSMLYTDPDGLALEPQEAVIAVAWTDGEIGVYRVRDLTHAVPCESCRCGFYAYYADHAPAPSSCFYGLPAIGGVIRGFGRTLLGTMGFRCEKAEIVALLRPDLCNCFTIRRGENFEELLEDIKKAFPGVPVLSDPQELTRFAPLTRLGDFA